MKYLLVSLIAPVLSACGGPDPIRPSLSPQLDSGVDAAGGAHDAGVASSDAGADATPTPLAPADNAASDATVVSEPPLPDAALTARAAVVVPEGWTVLEAGEDPFTDRPGTVSCSPASVMAELLSAERVLGVDTGGCDYLTASQPTRRAIALGESIKVRLWHFELSAPEPAEAHASLVLDGVQVLDERIPIPQPGGLIVKQVRAERSIPVGAEALFHLHNHGANSWALVEVSAGP